MTTTPPDLAPDQRLVLRTLDPVLSGAGYERRGFDWIAEPAGSFVAVSAVRAVENGVPAYSLQVGWRFDAFDDPPPEPATAHGCVRAMTFDQLAGRQGAPLGRVGGSDDRSLAGFEQRLATVATKELESWGRLWLRPEGFRDFVSAKEWHLGAAWASVLLGQAERAKLELVQAAHRYGEPLDEGFDRQRADLDEALAAVFASRHGLAAHLASAAAEVVGAFSSDRTMRARQRVTDPQSEHRRMQVRHRTYATLCLALVEASEAAGSR